jgi:hypothetical protein
MNLQEDDAREDESRVEEARVEKAMDKAAAASSSFVKVIIVWHTYCLAYILSDRSGFHF